MEKKYKNQINADKLEKVTNGKISDSIPQRLSEALGLVRRLLYNVLE